MKFFKGIGYFFSNFRKKYRISFRDPQSDREVWYMHLTPLYTVAVLVAFVLTVTAGIALVSAYTPILEHIPGHPATQARLEMIENNMRLDSLERQMRLWNQYYDNIVRIMDGKVPLMPGEEPDTVSVSHGEILRTPLDSVLRQQMEGSGVYGLTQGSAPVEDAGWFAPVKGIVRNAFDPMEGMPGVVIAAAEQPVLSPMEGSIIHSTWNPSEGAVVYILHPGSYISAYFFSGNILKKNNERVLAGEAIALLVPGEENESGGLEFRLWHNGIPVDPENYIAFN